MGIKSRTGKKLFVLDKPIVGGDTSVTFKYRQLVLLEMLMAAWKAI